MQRQIELSGWMIPMNVAVSLLHRVDMVDPSSKSVADQSQKKLGNARATKANSGYRGAYRGNFRPRGWGKYPEARPSSDTMRRGQGPLDKISTSPRK
jgi:hypothetical protein